MDTNPEDAAAVERLKEQLSKASTRALIAVTELFGDELLCRASNPDPRIERLHRLGAVHLVELRGRLRMVRAHELGVEPRVLLDTTSAAPGPAVSAIPPSSGAPGASGDTTTPGAAESFDTRPCTLCRGLAGAHAMGCTLAGTGLVAVPSCTCGKTHNPSCPADFSQWGRPLSALTAERSGQRGPKAAEGAREAGRAEQGRVDLSAHLAAVKAEGGQR